jgi:carboxyl-terminal processing protease
MKGLYVWLLIILAGICGYLIGINVNNDPYYAKLDEIRAIIQSSYWKEIDPRTLENSSINGMLKALDDYCYYFSPSEWREEEIHLKGKFYGVGILVSIDKDGQLRVISPIEGTPAFRKNILPDDNILAIDGMDTKGITLEEAVRKIRGKEGTRIRLRLQRGKEKPFEEELVRELIEVNPVKHRILEGEIGYIKVKEFNEKVVQEFDKAVESLLKAGMKKLVLDLRFNPGGKLMECVHLTDRFIKEGTIVSVKSRHGEYSEKAKKGGSLEDIPVVVLINKGSASASEIVAGAIRDHKRGALVGEKTYGKGTVQTFFPMDDGSQLKLTTGHYMTPSGRRIMKDSPVEPDHVVELTEDEILKMREKDDYLDKQLQKAIELLK